MTNAIPIRIADAVASQLNTAAAASEFTLNDWTARRSYPDWDDKFSDLSEHDLSIDVVFVPRVTPTLDDHASLEYPIEIHIAARQRLRPADRDADTGRYRNDAVDPLVTLLHEIHDYFAGRRGSDPLADATDATWQESDIKVAVDYKKLRAGLFYGWLSLRFDVQKDLP